MPRPNRKRGIQAERVLAARVAYEREKREWSYEGLAKRMDDEGCAINASALYKIEKADPPRRIVVDELVALARVFELSLEEMLTPPVAAEVARVYRALTEYDHSVDNYWDALHLLEADEEALLDAASELSVEALTQGVREYVDDRATEVGEDNADYDAARDVSGWIDFIGNPTGQRRYMVPRAYEIQERRQRMELTDE